MLYNGKFSTNFLENSNIFNDFFRQQCQSISNDGTLSLVPSYYQDNRLNDINFKHDKMLKVQSLDPSKAYGYDGVSASMLKLSCQSIIKPLASLYFATV